MKLLKFYEVAICMRTRIYIAKKAEWHFPEKNNGFSVILLLFTKAKIKHWRSSLGGRRRKQEHVADLNTQSKVSINFLS